MNKHYEAVVDFMQVMGQPVAPKPEFKSPKVSMLRYNLIKEELEELEEAIMDDDYVEIADALADLLYVIYGAHATFGVGVEDLDVYDRFEPWSAQILPYNRAKSALDSLNSELGSFERALEEYDAMDVRGPLDDLLDSVYRTAAFYGINIHACFDEVHASNMSKFCKTENDARVSLDMRKAAEETADKYKNAEVHQVGDVWVLRRSDNHKVLKGMDYFEPNLKQFLADL